MINSLEDKYRTVSKLHRQIVIKYLSQFDLYIGQPKILFSINNKEGITQNELVQELNNTKESISLSLNRLEQNDLIYRKQNTLDKRIKNIYLTEKGIEIVNQCKQGFDEINQSMFSGLSDTQKNHLNEIYDLMIDKLQQEIE